MTSDILKRAAEAEWLPCPFCGEELHEVGGGIEHPQSETCPLDSLWLRDEHRADWNRRPEIERLTARAEAAEAILADAGALRDAADRVSAWFATEARHLEGPRINGLRMAMVAYDRHMQPAPHAAMKEGR